MLAALATLLLQISPALSLAHPPAPPEKPTVVATVSGNETEHTVHAPGIVLALPLTGARGFDVFLSTSDESSETSATLPSEPRPFIAAARSSLHRLPAAPAAGLISVADLRAEVQRKNRIWLALAAAEHGAAAFDAWSTRRAIANGGHELDPLMKPFANSGAIYAATQAGPLLFDYLGKRMMLSRHPMLRRLWWLPQAASTAVSIFSGVHNLGVHGPAQP